MSSSARHELPSPIEAFCGDHGEYDLAHRDAKYHDPTCLLSRGCDGPLQPIPRCGGVGNALAMCDLDLARTTPGQALRLYGVLRIVGTNTTFIKCGDESQGLGSPCCNQIVGVVAVFDVRDVESFRMPRALLWGEDYTCHGDDSALCCKVDAVCRTVVVTGRVTELVADGTLRGTASERRDFGAGIKLDVTSLCVVDEPSQVR